MGRVTRPRPKPKPKFVHEVRARHDEVDQPWFAEMLARVAAGRPFKKRTPFWAYTIFSFGDRQQADDLALYLGRYRELLERRERKARPCPVRVRYEAAARAQHAVIWGLSTGIIREVVRVYRRERADCSSHGHPNMVAACVIVAAAPATDLERARDMVDAMLEWAIAHHGDWFWTGLQGDRSCKRYG